MIKHVQANLPEEVKEYLWRLPGHALPFKILPDHKSTIITKDFLTEFNTKEPIMIRFRISIPILPFFLKSLGDHPTVLSLSLNEENIHSQNEVFRLSGFAKRQIVCVKLYERVGGS